MSFSDTNDTERLWTPWRMDYVGGERRPTPPGVSIFAAIAADPAHDTENLVLYRGTRAFVVMNLYPYNTGHCLVVPSRQVATPDALDAGETAEIGQLLPWLVRVLTQTLHCDGLNIGLNIGAVAGAGVAEHLHWHLVPRWRGDANFMPILAKTTVMPELLPDTYAKIRRTIAADPAPIVGTLAAMPVQQAGGVVFHDGDIVLRRAADGSLVFPKGHLEPGETPGDAAIREVWEETGLRTQIVAPLGSHLCVQRGQLLDISWYRMTVADETDEWARHRDRDALLLPPADAAAALSYDDYRVLLARAVAQMAGQTA